MYDSFFTLSLHIEFTGNARHKNYYVSKQSRRLLNTRVEAFGDLGESDERREDTGLTENSQRRGTCLIQERVPFKSHKIEVLFQELNLNLCLLLFDFEMER